jgi:hypothetical protein
MLRQNIESPGKEVLRHIEITNFRGISHLSLDIAPPDEGTTDIVVIGGPNGTGKTAILEASLLAAGREDLVLGSIGPSAILAGEKDYCIKAEFRTIEKTRSVLLTSKSPPPAQKVQCDYFSSWRAPKLPGAVPVSLGRKGRKHEPSEANRLRMVKQTLVDAKAFNSMTPGGDSGKFVEAMNRVNEVWQLFYPDAGEAFTIEAAGSSPEAGFDVFLNRPGGNRIALDSLSSGQLEVFLLAASVISEREPASIIFIDEPELHMDSQWHRLILRAMRRLRPRCQFIVATHSAEIYESIMSYQRYYIVPDGDPRGKSGRPEKTAVGAEHIS